MGAFLEMSNRLASRSHVTDSATDGTGQSNADYALRDKWIRIFIPADAAAGDEKNYVLMTAEKAIELVSASVLPSAAVTADGSN